MRKATWLIPLALVAAAGWFFLSGPAHSQRPSRLESLTKEIAKRTNVAERDVAKVLEALGPAVSDQVAAGRQVDLPNLAQVRVVRIPEHRELIDGRPATVPAVNYVEFLPTGNMVQAANSPVAVPSVEVPPFEYNPLPNRTEGQRAPSSRAPSSRIR